MGRSKRKKGEGTAPSITEIASKAVAPVLRPLKSPPILPKGELDSKSASSPAQSQLPTISRGPGSLRQSIAKDKLQRSSGNEAGYLRVEYLAKVATWAAANVPPLGAFMGQRLAAASEAAAIVPPTPQPLCQRCESVLQVGENCSVRVVKAPKKWRKARARGVGTGLQSAVVYMCHFCKFGNKKPGTARGHVKTKKSQLAALAQMKTLGSRTPATTAALPQIKSNESSKARATMPALAQINRNESRKARGTMLACPQINSNESREAPATTPILPQEKKEEINEAPATTPALPQEKRNEFSEAPATTPALPQIKRNEIRKPTATSVLPEVKSHGSSKTPAGTPGFLHADLGTGLKTSPGTPLTKGLGSNKLSAKTPALGSVQRPGAISSVVGVTGSPVTAAPANSNSMGQTTGGGKKRKRKGWSSLKDMATAQLELPSPARLGFMSPSNPNTKG